MRALGWAHIQRGAGRDLGAPPPVLSSKQLQTFCSYVYIYFTNAYVQGFICGEVPMTKRKNDKEIYNCFGGTINSTVGIVAPKKHVVM